MRPPDYVSVYCDRKQMLLFQRFASCPVNGGKKENTVFWRNPVDKNFSENSIFPRVLFVVVGSGFEANTASKFHISVLV